MKRFLFFTILCALIFNFSVAHGQGDISYKVDVQGLYGGYGKSTIRESTQSVGLFLVADYLDKAGMTIGYNHTEINFKSGNPDISQDGLFLSGRMHLTPDRIPGKLTMRFDFHFLDNDDITKGTDNVKVVAPQLSFLSFGKRLYLDLGFARSGYENNLHVSQWTPTVGLGFNQNADYLQLRGYIIDPSNSARAQGEDLTGAFEGKWTHHFGPQAFLKISNFQTSILLGERVFAVDGDAGAVYNLADVQKGTFTAGVQWNVAEGLSILLIGGYERYENQTLNDSYYNGFGYLNVSKKW